MIASRLRVTQGYDQADEPTRFGLIVLVFPNASTSSWRYLTMPFFPYRAVHTRLGKETDISSDGHPHRQCRSTPALTQPAMQPAVR